MSKSIDNRQKWIKTGYELFGEIGPEALNIEKLSNLIGIKRSSFYHHFGDLESFEREILQHHVNRYEIIWEIIKDYSKFEQLFSDEVFSHRDVLAFQRQLMIHESIERYKKCSQDARKYTEEKTFQLWSAFNHSKNDSEEEWKLFRAIRDFYYVRHGQANNTEDPKEVLVMLQNYLNKG